MAETDFSNNYKRTVWEPGNAITARRMNNLEEGVEINRENTIKLDQLLEDNETGVIQQIKTLNNNKANTSMVTNAISSLDEKIEQSVGAGKTALDQLESIIHIDHNSGNITYSLAQWKEAIEGGLKGFGILNQDTANEKYAYDKDNTVYAAIEALKTAIGRKDGLTGELVYQYDPNTPKATRTVAETIDQLTETLSTVNQSIGTIKQDLNNAQAKADFADSQIKNALRQNLVDGNNQHVDDSLVKRFNEITTLLDTHTQDIASKLTADSDHIINGFTSEMQLAALSANAGRILNDKVTQLQGIVGSGFDNSDNTIAKTITNAINTAVNTANGYTDQKLTDNNTSEIGAAHRENVANDTLKQRFESNEADIAAAQSDINAIENELKDARPQIGTDEEDKPIYGTLDNRFDSIDGQISQIENELNTAHISSVVRTPGQNQGDPDTDTTYSSLDERLEAIEGHAAKVRTDVNTIANELAMVDDVTHNIKDTNTKIDDLTSDVHALAEEIAMGQDENGRLIGAETRLDTIDADLNTASTGLKAKVAALETTINTETSGLSDRVIKLESDINNSTTGLAAIKTIADANTAAIGDSTSGLTKRVYDLEREPKSATEVISVSNFAELTADEAHSHKDYLVGPDENNLYKYYHIIETSDNVYEKVLISGGIGEGTSSAQFAATLNEITNPDINTDYYIGNNNDGYLHYRYIEESGSNTLKSVIIGLHDYYQIDTREVSEDNDTVTYLDLYKFDENRTQASLDYDTDKNNIIGTVKLPKGGGAVSSERIYVKIPAGQSQYISYKDLQDNGLSLGFSYTCYSVTNGDYEYESAIYTLATESGEIIKESNGPISPLTREAYNAGTINISFNREDNLARYCTKNNMTKFILTLSVPDREDIIPRTLTVMITPVELSLTSTFSDQRTYTNTDDLIIPYDFIGIRGENINFEILFGDGNTEENITASSVINSQASRITIRRSTLANKVGIYNLRIRASQLISGTALYSNTLAYQIGLIELNYANVLLFSGASIEEQVTEQYRTLDLPYYLYLPSNMESAIVSYDVKQVFYNDQKVVVREDTVPSLIRPADTLSTGAQNYSLRISNMIAETEYYKVTITCEDASLVFNIRANIASQQINIETQGLIFDFKPEQFSNNATTLEERLWNYESNGIKYSMRIPDNAHFDWRTGGWVEDENHIPCFCVKAGSRVEFVQQNIGQDNISPLTLFWNGMESTGSNFKCVFKIDNVKTPDAPFLTSLDTVENTIINYGKLILSDKQDIEDDSTLLHSYLNTRYLYTKTINNKGKVVKESIGTTVLDDGVNEVYGRFGSQLTEAKRAAAETKAAKKNTDKIKNYINNIYTIANYARILEHKEALLNILSGNSIGTAIDYTTIQDNILSYLQNVTNATAVYNTLTTLENDTSSIIYAYRQEEPENLDAILNGFVVEGKEGKDGIIAMLEFTFETTIKNGGTFTSQTVSTEEGWPRTNTFTSTATFLVMVEDKKYEVTMKDENGTYTEIVSIQDASNETQTAYGLELNALGSNIYLPSGRVSYAHSEGDTIEFEYNINAPLDQKINSSIIIYEDGVPSAAKLYTTGNGILEQQTPGKLTIGSDDCDVYIYKMRLYDRTLTDKQILNNFYADGLTVDDMIARYNRNKNLITDNIDELTPQLVAQECPDLRVIMIEAPNLTGGKTSFIKNTKIRCIYKNGRPEDNWVALNAYHAGQGTSSDNYGASARNLDIIFGFDGKDTVIVPKPQKNNYQFDPSYKSILIKGLDKDTTNDIKTAQEYEEEGYSVYYNTGENEPGTVSLTKDSVPNNWFNIKVNVASSENTNNAFLQKRFNRYLEQHVYKTPAQKRDYRIKNDMEFFNCAIFIKETGTPKEFLNDNGEERHWHFYGIGNIGDSKKTDKTRVNVPSDPYEFAVEITDNGLLLSGFSSGVFYISEASKLRSQTNNADIAAASSMTKSHVCSSGEYTANNGTYTFSISSPNAETMYFVPENNGAYYRRFIYLNNVWTEVGEPISFARTSYGIKYPISKAEWECSLNTYHEALYNFGGKGWDKSFEFRYDITTKDGETVARSDLEEALNELHQSANKKAFADMYSYIVTVPNANFVSQLNNWFIENSLPYWYLFTERYTMIDSRAKNTFYHYGKIYITEDEASGAAITALNEIKNSHLSEYIADNHIQPYNTATAEQIANAELDYQISTATFLHDNAEYFEVDNAKAAINNGYRFELWGYDMDTALGINNNGQMVFSAGVEDTDKDASGWIYNEAESVIWRRVRENMYTQLAALYINLKADCFNAENLINEFDQLQAQFPEELWRADFERKYYRPFRDLNETTYLNDMANGRKKYQRRQFERNMAIYINSKYQRNGSYLENDLISFRPQFTWTEGRDTRIIIKPYSTMYINFALGNYDNTTDNVSEAQSIFKRVERGEEFVINTSDYIHDYNNIQCIIYNASRLMYLDGLGNFECKQFILGAAKKLSVLKLGSSVYTNRSMTDITNLGLSTGLPLLEELDLTNIEFGTSTNNTWVSNPPQTFALENFPLLKKLNAEGCNIRSFTFKDGGMLEHIIFPAGLTSIQFKNLYKLVDTYNDGVLVPAVVLTGAANLIDYYSTNSYSSSYSIVQNMINNSANRITQLYLDDINWTINNIIDLEPLVTLQQRLGNKMYLKGIINIIGDWSIVEKNKYQAIWENVEFNTSEGTEKIKCAINYYNTGYISNDGEIPDQLITTIFVDSEGNDSVIPDIYADVPVNELPSRESTIAYTYSFGSYDENDKYIPYSGWTLNPRPASGDPIPLSSDYNINDKPYQPPAGVQEISLYTYFYVTSHKYKVQWKVGDKVIKETDANQDYGGGYSLIAPTIIDVRQAGVETSIITSNSNGTFNYSVFEGWEKLPINITPTKDEARNSTYVINAKWSEPETKTLDEFFANTSELTTKQLAILSKLNQTTVNEHTNIKNIVPTSKFNYTMGYDGVQNGGTELINSNNIVRMSSKTGTLVTYNTVKPFASKTAGQDKGFTLVIDYQFGEINTGSAPEVLVGCYDKDSTGSSICSFALYRGYNETNGGSGTFVCYGVTPYSRDSTKRRAVGDATHRNIIVLRREKNSSTLRIYTGLNADSTTSLNTALRDNISIELSTLNTSDDAVICIGALRSDLNTNSRFSEENTNAKRALGTVYWMKYWDEDLGLGECLQLASWPHERMTAILSAINNIDKRPKLYFTNLNCSKHSMVTNDSFAVPNANDPGPYSTGWLSSNTKAIYDNRVVYGLPVELQAVIKKPSIGYYNYVAQRGTDGTEINLSELRSVDAYVYAPSISSLDLNHAGVGPREFGFESIFELTGDTEATTSLITPYQWMRAPSGVINARRYVGSGSETPWTQITPEAYWLNIRFNEKPINFSSSNKMNIYVIDSSTIGSRTFYNAIGETNIQPGDIVIYRTVSSGTTTLYGVYMFIPTSESSTLGLQTLPNESYWDTTSGNRTAGGWIQSTPYVTRSVSLGGTGRYPNYVFVDEQGDLKYPNLSNDQAAAGSLSLDFAFTI